jgi:hypothetical protein|tara:strand:- start:1231 stop:1581 length:351 start_codon:yes stop_codon:yes gene_type:complete
MKKLLMLLFLAAPVSAQSVTPNFTQGSMQSTTTTTVDIERNIAHEIFGGSHTSWSGSNVTPSDAVGGAGTTFSITDSTQPWSLEITTRDPGVIETIDINEVINSVSTTTSLSIFSQ